MLIETPSHTHILLYIYFELYLLDCCALYPIPSDATDDINENPVRNLSVIREMIMGSDLPAVVKERSVQVFTELGVAEAKTHGSTLDQVPVGLFFAPSSCAKSGSLQVFAVQWYMWGYWVYSAVPGIAC